MKLATLLPYKENYSPKFSGAVSIHVSNLYKYSKYKKEIFIYGSTNENKYLTPNYINFSVNTTFLTSNNKEYLKKFIINQKHNESEIIEIHNRPNYVKKIADNLKSKIILYFHNNPLTISGSMVKNERLYLLEKCEYIFLIVFGQKINFSKILTKNYIIQNMVFVFNLQKDIK